MENIIIKKKVGRPRLSEEEKQKREQEKQNKIKKTRGRKQKLSDEEREQKRHEKYKLYYENVIKPRMKERHELYPSKRGRGRPKTKTMEEIRAKEREYALKYYYMKKANAKNDSKLA